MTRISYDAQGREIEAPVRVEEAKKRAGCASKGVKNAQVRENDAQVRAGKVINTSRARGLDVDGLNIINSSPLRPRARMGEPLLCTWREAVKATDYALEHFGDRERDRGIWIWYCRRIGLDTFLDIVDEVISCTRQGELRWPVRALQRHLQEALPKEGISPERSESRKRPLGGCAR